MQRAVDKHAKLPSQAEGFAAAVVDKMRDDGDATAADVAVDDEERGVGVVEDVDGKTMRPGRMKSMSGRFLVKCPCRSALFGARLRANWAFVCASSITT
ncbi:hypothetical protein [Corynebacterium glaucum]|uniref:hypothetical protein n=1 Tax=Corynebacterium glaucum TaxID=187491 RepID=UPI0012FD4C13|nr:hypothetical protein [Corynebacterium glaucum]